MKTFLKVVGILVLVILGVAAAGVAWLSVRKPAQRPPSTETVQPTPELLARGKYVVHNISQCLECHSDHTKGFALPIKPGSEGMGGYAFTKEQNFPGVLRAQNITPDKETGLGDWTDGEILRAVREGVGRDGQALFPMMPYKHYRSMSDDDAKAVVAYLRTLKPIRNPIPPTKVDFPLNLIIKFIPKPLEGPVAAPSRADNIAYGKYLSIIGGCYECHTPHNERNELIPERAFSGGWEMKGEWGRNLTANITPHPGTFLGRATKEEWIGRFHSYAAYTPESAPEVPPGANTVMPWIGYSGMTDEDLGAIYDYLKTVPPIENKVNAFPDRK
jgi:mono/diheme cytochrome c family protein